MLTYKKKKLEKAQVVIGIVMRIWALMILFPFYNAILASISPSASFRATLDAVSPGSDVFGVQLPDEGHKPYDGYRNTLFFGHGVHFSMLITVATAYVLSRPSFPGKKSCTRF
jgi:putative aldouronate transport system permease protein